MATGTTKEMSELLVRIEENCKKFNTAKEYNEYEEMSRITKDLDADVASYNEMAEAETIRVLHESPKPLLAAAVMLKYATIGYRDVAIDPEDKDHTERQINFGLKYIDTQKLHKHTSKGVGEDPNWIYAVQKLNFLLTVRQAKRLDIDPALINACYSMKQEAKKFEGLQTDSEAVDEIILQDIDRIVKMMIGESYSAKMADVAFLQGVYTKKSSKSALTVSASNHSNMRNHMLDICHRAATNSTYALDCKLNKKAVDKFTQDQLAALAALDNAVTEASETAEARAKEEAPAAKKTRKSSK